MWPEKFGSNVVKYINSSYSHGKQTLFLLNLLKSWLWHFWQRTWCLQGLTDCANHGATGCTALCSPFACPKGLRMHQLDKFALTLRGSNLKMYLKGSICRRLYTCSEQSMWLRFSLAQFQSALWNAGKLWKLKIERNLLNEAHNALHIHSGFFFPKCRIKVGIIFLFFPFLLRTI